MRILAFVLFVAAACGGPAPTSGTSGKPGSASDSAAAAPAPPAPEPCEAMECGPKMGMPNQRCPDGSTAGPTGRCLRQANGRCTWEIRRCP